MYWYENHYYYYFTWWLGGQNFGNLNHTGEMVQVGHCAQHLLGIGLTPNWPALPSILTLCWHPAGAPWAQIIWSPRISWFLTPRAWHSWNQNDLHESRANHEENSLLTWTFCSVLEAGWQELFCFVWDLRKGFGRETEQWVPLPVREIGTNGGYTWWGVLWTMESDPAFDCQPRCYEEVLGRQVFRAQKFAGQKSVYSNHSYVPPWKQRHWHISGKLPHGTQKHRDQTWWR